ncbi:FtsX-like permease family protein [Demequina sp.]|uniref:FtsX-like permease family protein n=1 Tax=Demequina sp. TaxID=2050685 RepID=UPI003D0F6494
MIWSLAREQVRSQRRYIGWAAVVVALAVATAVYGALLSTTLRQASTDMGAALVFDAEYTSIGSGATGGPDVGLPLFDTADLAADVETAQAQGTRVAAYARVWGLSALPGSDPEYNGQVTAAMGDLDWDQLLLDGEPPSSGQVVLTAAVADVLGVSLGDAIPLYGEVDVPQPLVTSVTVSGISVSNFDSAGLSLYGYPEVLVAWDDFPLYTEQLSELRGDDEPTYYDLDLYWDGESTVLNDALTQPAANAYGFETGTNNASIWVAMAAVVLVIGAIAMAFAFGRAQAQSRTQWVATARALGASKRHIVLATCVEAGLLAIIGVAAGSLLGFAGAAVHLGLVHGDVPGAAIASVPIWTPLVVVGAAVLASLLAVVVASVPAFWATRVSPTAALKPENDITNAQVGRRVSFWPVAIAWAVAGTLAVVSADPTEVNGAPLYGELAWWLFIGLSFVVANEALRWLLPALGRWLSRRPEKAALVAGDSIVARPRQFTVPALLMALGTGAMLFASIGTMLSMINDYVDPHYVLSPGELQAVAWQTWTGPAAAVVLGVLALLSTIITVATTTVTSRERATREALGVTPGQTRAGAGIAQAITLVSGVVVGIALATALIAVSIAHGSITGVGSESVEYVAMSVSVRATCMVVGIALLCSALSALAIASAARTPQLTPRAAETGRVS